MQNIFDFPPKFQLRPRGSEPALLIGSAIVTPVPAGHENECRPAPRPSAPTRFRKPGRLQWKGDGLHLDGKGRGVVRIVPDKTYADMWRVELPDSRLSDMVNRARAKDAAVALACAALNQRGAIR
jgi:hypothetical protein